LSGGRGWSPRNMSLPRWIKPNLVALSQTVFAYSECQKIWYCWDLTLGQGGVAPNNNMLLTNTVNLVSDAMGACEPSASCLSR